MSEVFEIGVSLALRDGVSDGIAAAKRDMQAVQLAINAGAVSIQQLRESSLAALGITRGERTGLMPAPTEKASAGRDRARDHDTVPPAGASERSDASSYLPTREFNHATSQTQAPMSAHGSVSAVASALNANAPPEAISQIPKTERIPVLADELVRPVGRVSTNLDQIAIAPVNQRGGRISAPEESRAGPIALAPVISPAADPSAFCRSAFVEPTAPQIHDMIEYRNDARTPPMALPEPAPRIKIFCGTSETPAAVLPPVLASNSVSEQAGGRAVINAPLYTSLQYGGFANRRPFGATDAYAADSPKSADAQSVISAAATQPPPGQPMQTPRDTGPTEGDVFLDGMLVGRWMSRFLARSAARSSSGSTGFDPRRNAILPGPAVRT